MIPRFVVFGYYIVYILLFQVQRREFLPSTDLWRRFRSEELPTQHKDLRRSETKSCEWSVEEKVRWVRFGATVALPGNSQFAPENGWLEDDMSFWAGLFSGANG